MRTEKYRGKAWEAQLTEKLASTDLKLKLYKTVNKIYDKRSGQSERVFGHLEQSHTLNVYFEVY